MPDVTEVASRITRVEVYRSQALVTRQARLDLERSGTVRLGPLPVLLADDSVRAAVPAGSGARIADLQVGWDISPRGGSLDTESEKKLRELIHQLTGLQVERKRLQDHLRFLESLTPEDYATVDLPDQLAFAERQQLPAWLKLENYLEKELLERRSAIRGLQRQVEEMEDSIREARDELERQSRAEAEMLASFRKEVVLSIESEKPLADLVVDLSYLVPFARWLPEYELRVEPGGRQAELILKALVAQSSGEDWRQARLSFSTADLQRSAELPELESWRIGKVQPTRPSGWRELPDTLGELFVDYDRGVRSVSPPAPPARRSLPSMPALDGVSPAQEIDRRRSTGREVADRLMGQVASVSTLDDKTVAPADPQDDDDLVDVASRSSMAPPPSPAVPAAAPGMAVSAGEIQEEYEVEADSALREESFVARDLEVPAGTETPKKRKRAANYRMEFKRAAPVPARGQAAPLAEPKPQAKPAPSGIRASQRALTFDSLRMQGPGDSSRGQLVAEDPLEPLANQLAQKHPEAADLVRERGEDLLESFHARGDQLSRLALPEQAVPVEQSAGHFAVRYPKEGPGEVLSDGRLHGLTLLSCRGQVRRLFRCVPLEEPQVYRIAEFENPVGLPLLSGPVSVYRGGDFVVRAPLSTTPPGQVITVNLGVEPGIRVSRNSHFNESTSGMFGGGTLLEQRVELELGSALFEPARVELFERVPVSHHDDIRVELVKTEPAADKYDQKERGALVEGGLRFSVDLSPGEKKRCQLHYRITIPSKQVLRGGNRRD